MSRKFRSRRSVMSVLVGVITLALLFSIPAGLSVTSARNAPAQKTASKQVKPQAAGGQPTLASSLAGATIHVTTTAQTIDGGDGFCSLPEAIYSANFDHNVAIYGLQANNADHFTATECEPGSGADTIVLPAGAVFLMGSIVLDAHNPMGPTATPIIFSNIIIEANGSRIEHAPNNVFFRAFAVGEASVAIPNRPTVSGTGDLTIRNAYIKGFQTKGGNGGAGTHNAFNLLTAAGGGGLGAGGAIYLRGGALTVESSTFDSNSAAGGDGGGSKLRPDGFLGGGGGGGLSGNGGEPTDGSPGGGGGGGARGRGGDGGGGFGPGGGGGGTVTDGAKGVGFSVGGQGGFKCGGDGGDSSDDGDDGACPGGGGGGGGGEDGAFFSDGDGGRGSYGGGGGGGGENEDGGSGGFGGGGGGGDEGGDGDFGGGGGSSLGRSLITGNRLPPGDGGAFGGHGSDEGGGGGAGLGGAIFSHGGNIRIYNSTFTRNVAVRGVAGGAGAANGSDAGAAIFSVNGSLSVVNATISGNEGTGAGGGIVLFSDGASTSFTLRNTIIAGNGVRECFYTGDVNAVTAAGSGNLIQNNFGCPGMAQTDDPQLGPLHLNTPGTTPTMAITGGSPALDTGDDANCQTFDQRGVARPQGLHCDIGAYEEVANNPPTITTVGVTREKGSPAVNSQVATVGDEEDAEESLIVTVNGATSANGVTVSNFAANSSGQVTADVEANCAATDAAFTLRVTDGGGLFAEATLNVTVVDTTPPVVTSSLLLTMLGPPFDHSLINVGLAASATDGCEGLRPVSVKVFGDENDESVTGNDGNFSPDARDIAPITLRQRRERIGTSDGRVYLIVTKAADTSGNTGFSCRTVVAPLDTKASSLSAVNAQAATARAYCEANGGAAPAGYFVIGDGPIIGKKK